MKLSPGKRSARQLAGEILIRFSFDRKTTVWLAASILTFAVLSVVHLRSTDAQSSRVRFQQDMAQIFLNHEDVKLDARAITDQVREFGHLSLRTAATDFEIELRPNDLRSPKYRAAESAGGVEREVLMPPAKTFKGTVNGLAGADARFTIDADKVEGMILTAQDSYFVEPAAKYSAAAETSDYIVYRASDVRPDITRTCVDTLDQKITTSARQFASASASEISPAVFSPFRVVEMATEADFQYVNALGGSTATNNDILSIMNSVQAIYERDIGLTFTIVFQHTWTTADPFVTTGTSVQPAVNLLNSFTDYWNLNFANVNRDDVHLWTGKNLGGPAGVAWQGVVCFSANFSYGLSDLENLTPFRVGIPAHEIGHNFNATHCDAQTGCDNSIMVATQTQANTQTFCPFSVNEMTTFVTANSGCLSLAGANPVIQFNAATYNLSEGSPRVTITVNRTGNTTAAASVGYATNDAAGLQPCSTVNGTASPRCDYTNVIGRVQFAAGETSQTFSVPIVDDSYAEGNETFTVSLNNVSGATLGTPFTTTVTISDNETVNGPNPIDGTDFFVRQHYIDFLGREPDSFGFDGWKSTINNCAPGDTSCDRIHVSQIFFQSDEFQSRGYYVYRFYPVSFGRKPFYAEFVLDLAPLSGFLTPAELEAAKAQFALDFTSRSAFAAIYGGLNNTQYVDTLLATAGVILPASTRQSLIDGLNNSSLSRGQVLRQIVDSSEVQSKFFNQAYAVMEYFGYLRREPDIFYLDWIKALDQTGDPRGMVTGFVNSVEYRQRFGPP